MPTSPGYIVLKGSVAAPPPVAVPPPLAVPPPPPVLPPPPVAVPPPPPVAEPPPTAPPPPPALASGTLTTGSHEVTTSSTPSIRNFMALRRVSSRGSPPADIIRTSFALG